MIWILHWIFLFLFNCLFFICISVNSWVFIIWVIAQYYFILLCKIKLFAVENFQSFLITHWHTYIHLGGGDVEDVATDWTQTIRSSSPFPILGMYLLPITPTAGVISKTQPLEGKLSKSSYEATITLIPNPGKGTTKK